MLSDEAKKARNDYMKEYRKKNRERINAQERRRYHANKDRFKKYREDYWERKAQSEDQSHDDQ